MPARVLPGLGLTAFWGTGASGWDVAHDPDTRLVSILCQCRVLSRVTALPGSPTDGDVYLVPSDDGTHPNEIAARDNGAWVYVNPIAGFMAYVEDEDEFVVWDAAVAEWAPLERAAVVDHPTSFTLGAGVPCGARLRPSAAAANTLGIAVEATAYYPVGFWFEVEQAGAGKTTVVPASGVTVRSPETLAIRAQFSVVKLMKVAADEWTLSGDIEPV